MGQRQAEAKKSGATRRAERRPAQPSGKNPNKNKPEERMGEGKSTDQEKKRRETEQNPDQEEKQAKTEQNLEQDRKQEAKQEKMTVTQIDLEGREVADEKAGQLMKQYLNYAPYLNSDDSYAHHIEQLYLMCREGFRKEFIEEVFCYGREISLVSLDLLRCIALIGGEEFAMKFYKGNYSLGEVKDTYADFAAREKFSQFDEIEKLRQETELARERFDLQMEFLRKEQENSKAYADDRIRSEREAAEERLKQQQEYSEEKIRSLKITFETEKSLLKSEADRKRDALETELGICTVKLDSVQKELDALCAQLETVQVENQKLAEERDRLVSENEKLKAQLAERTLQPGKAAVGENQPEEVNPVAPEEQVVMKSPTGTGDSSHERNLGGTREEDMSDADHLSKPGKKGLIPFHQKHKRKETRKRDDFVIDLIKNPEYTDEQFEIIYSAVKAGMPLKELEQIRNPELPARNMQMLANYFIRKDAGIPAGKEANENGSTDENHPAGGSGERA
ncbi:MAG: hypothetical protein LIO94_13735 [Clostridiales bacterium]|nr:hypothetical protein [Clostridiales bacterium]